MLVQSKKWKCRDKKKVRKQFNKCVLIAVVIATTLTEPGFAQGKRCSSGSRQGRSQCVSQFTNKPGNLTISGDCIPYQLWVNPEYGEEYTRLMQIAINTGANKDDFNTAIINFYRAQEISGVTDSEVRRGLLGAIMARAIQKNPVAGYSPARIWLLITGEYGS